MVIILLINGLLGAKLWNNVEDLEYTINLKYSQKLFKITIQFKNNN
jgi:hypothetical protein